jgi:hypothetical protein
MNIKFRGKMNCKTKLFLLPAFIVMAAAFFITGNAGAKYMPDGATQNASGGWDLPTGGGGSCAGHPEKTSLPDCKTVTYPSYTTSSACATGGGAWMNVCNAPDGTPISLKGLDRTAKMCALNGGTWTQGCVGNWIVSGAYTYYGGNDCLRCHNSTAQYSPYADEDNKESYLKTGHKNTLRKVQPQSGPSSAMNSLGTPIYTFSDPWAGPDSNGNLAIYTTDGNNTVNFSDASVTIGGGSYAGKRNLYWIYGGWISSPPGFFYGTDAYDGARTTFGANNGYPCANCHTTGFQDDFNPGIAGIAPTPQIPAEPQASFPGLGPVAAANARWDLYGVQCSMCHYSADSGFGLFNPTYPAQQPFSSGMGMLMLRDHAVRINICFGCHQSTAGTGVSPTPGVQGGDPTKIPTGANHGAAYGRDFNADVGGDAIGNSFLNSVHGQFNGRATTGAGTMIMNPVGTYDLFDPTPTQFYPTGGMATEIDYGSAFTSYDCWMMPGYGYHSFSTNADGSKITTPAQCTTVGGSWVAEPEGTCTTCHDVHQSFAIAGAKPIKRQCEDCHVAGRSQSAVGAPTVDASNILHPTGSGTPFDKTRYESSCIVCHMATQAVANGDQVSVGVHLWRINTNPSYNTFPTVAQFYGGSCSVHAGPLGTNNSFVKVYSSDTSSADCSAAGGAWTTATQNRLATTSADAGEGYNNAVWVDLDLACGQCHGGSGTATHNGAPYIAKADLAPLAAVMHGVPAGTQPPAVSSTITAANNASAAGSLITLADVSTDPVTPQTSLIVVVDWGDGTVSNTFGGKSITHTYAAAGTYDIVETVTNAAGLSASQYTLEIIAAASPVTSISGTVYNSFDGSVPAAGVKVKLKNAAGMISAITTTDASGNYSFDDVDFTKGPYTIIAKNVGTQFSYTSIPGISAAASGQNLNLNAATIRVSGGTSYPYAKVIITNGSKTITQWTSTIVPIGTNTDYFTKFKNLSATAPWTISATTTVTGTTTVLTCTVDNPSVDLTAVSLDLTGETPIYKVNITNCQ